MLLPMEGKCEARLSGACVGVYTAADAETIGTIIKIKKIEVDVYHRNPSNSMFELVKILFSGD